MASHYSDIGFQVKSVDDISRIVSSLPDTGELITATNGIYYRVSLDKFIEFWLHLDKNNNLHNLDFHFAGKNYSSFRFEGWISDPENRSPMSGTLKAWYVPDQELFPIIVDVPNADLYRDLVKNEILNLQIACFAHTLSLYNTKDDYYDSQSGEHKFSDEHFIPSGSFSFDESPEFQPSANAIFSGYIKSFEKFKNSMDKGEYFYFVVECQGIFFDVLADSELITQAPQIGGILSGDFWLSGKIIPEEKESFFSRIKKKWL